MLHSSPLRRKSSKKWLKSESVNLAEQSPTLPLANQRPSATEEGAKRTEVFVV